MDRKKVIALGFFDGVHLGHRALLDRCCQMARQLSAEAAVLTFDTHPQSLVSGNAPALINTPHDRMRLLREFGMDGVYTLHFDAQTMAMPWENFFELLLGQFGAAGIVCGDDFRFGQGGEGNAQKLAQHCREQNIPCAVIPEQTVDGVRVCSTHIRALVERGEMETAVRFLGHPHILTGTVVTGRKLGRTIGVPTANLVIPQGVIVPKFGVYACMAQVGQEKFPAVTNVGTRPTVGGHRVTVEPWILDFEGDLYGKEITLEFHKYLRPEEKFPSLENLQAEIQKNAAQTREFFGFL